MTESTSMTVQKVKVYELAKELGLDSITLLEKLKQLDIDVKNHMSSLGSEEVKAVRDQVAKEQALLTKTNKTTKKKESEPASVQKRVGTTVIRRRAKGSEDPHSPTTNTQDSVVTSSSVPSSEEVSVKEPVTESTTAASTAEPIQETKTVAKKVSTKTAAETLPPKPQVIVEEQKGSGLKMPSLLGSKKDGASFNKGGSILKIVKEEPMPVKKPPQVKPLVKGPSQTIVSLGKDAIEKLVEDEQNSKKKGARSEKEEDVKFSDYRAKKELIFLPKKKKVPTNKEIRKTEITKPAAHKRVIRIDQAISVADFAARMSLKSSEIIKKLMQQGMMVTMNQMLDLDTATLLAGEYGFEIENVSLSEESLIPKFEDKDTDLQPRPPVVTVMGHVDHGKTSLLDAIRSAKVAAGEAGGITQHIGAYTVELDGKKITFIDTPGHEAFTSMRSRGANVTDIVILVVAADDGVMPQTREAVDHARAAGVPIIVAVNKIDKPGANPDRVLKGLSELGLLSESWGGENIFVNVSALKGTGIKELLESVLLQAEVLDLKANPKRAAEGIVLEAQLDRSKGAVVDVLVKRGTLSIGETLVAGQFCGRVRALTDDKGKSLKSIGPGHAAQLLGLEGVPTAGDTVYVFETEAEARKLAEFRAQKIKMGTVVDVAKSAKLTLEELFSKVQQGDVKELPVIVKADVFGSSEAIKDSLSKIATDKVKVKVLSASTGGVTESDVLLASASNAIILAFNVRPETKALATAEREGIEVKTYSIIYELLDDVKKAMAGLLDKKAVEKYLGRAEVRNTFVVPKAGTIAGCFVIDGKILRGCQVRLLRDNRVIYTGALSSLKRFKDDVKEVAQSYECGMGIENFNDIKVGDVIEAFQIDMVAQELTPSTPSKNTSSSAHAGI